ncbi:phosphohydrolase [Deinococcus malanensis]|uniref:Phosphohydrolase n=1 Tax=Deinococcus malanensis TaxID=1706855 RepID=A0ABQ2EL22_9DEIO|nr:phosphohydrolase [Deinococcus malanensis]GGK12464.1 phosphohydrolase [Deinococcus malanensis]
MSDEERIPLEGGQKFRLSVEDGNVSDVGLQADAAAPEPEGAQRVVEYATPRAKLIEEASQAIRTDLRAYPRAMAAFAALHNDPEALAHWDMANYITMRKLGYNDHGRVHAFITGAASLAITELLLEGGVKPDLMDSGIGDADDVHLVVILGTMLHDIGNQVHRVAHEEHGVRLALPIIDRIMAPLYPDPFKRTKVRSFILSCINCHDLNPVPLTIEGGITAVADGTDITKGRGRKAFSLGSVDIHSISALAVDEVVIERGQSKPVLINVTMNNSGGIFQVEEILAPKVIRTPLRRFVELRASMREAGEEQILSRVRLEGDAFVMDLDGGGQVAVEVKDSQKQSQEAIIENLGIGNDSR